MKNKKEQKQIGSLYSLHYSQQYRNKHLEIPFQEKNKKCITSPEGVLIGDASNVFVNKLMQQKKAEFP